jgi:uncharacterized protein
MTGLTYPSFQASFYRVPGVYGATSPRAPTAVPLRMDVAGFIGFEPRVRDSDPASQLTGGLPPTGHAFFVDVSAVQVNLRGQRVNVTADPRLLLSQNASAIPVIDGQSIIYSIVVAARMSQAYLIVAAGNAATTGNELPPEKSVVDGVVTPIFKAAGDTPAVAASRPWCRLADVTIRRTGASVTLTVIPVLRVTRCDDWNDYLAVFGTPRDDGTVLGRAVRAYFANGGSRCYVSTIRRPSFSDPTGLAAAAQEAVGIQGSGERDATGLERLMLIDEISYVDVPDLYARQTTATLRTVLIPLSSPAPRFRRCPATATLPVVQQATMLENLGPPLFPANLGATDPWTDPFLGLQLQMIARCMVQPGRMLLLLSPPLTLDGSTYVTPDGATTQAWRALFDAQLKTGSLANSRPGTAAYRASCVALYFPWLVIQEMAGATPYTLPPTPLAAGVIARRDLARGPAIAPANETLSTVVGVDRPIDDTIDADLYSPPPDPDGTLVPAVNIIRPFAGYGIQVWGARTLSTDPWMQFINVRRTLSAIERSCKAALDLLVFEPNTPFLWAQITQGVMGVLLPLYESGGLQGDQPDQAFYVRCDDTINTAETIAAGQLICEVGVAIASPAEFIVFRIGRQEGVVQVLE